MCGIAGSLRLDGAPAEAAAVRRMASILAHRGPDGEGFAEDGPCALGHRRLSILDLSDAGRQPMADASGRLTVTFNGEIYNYLELREDLRRAGATFRTGTDTEVLLEGWAREGPEFLPRCNGMFAFALWDRAARTLWCARDRFGEKPFFYRHLPGREFRFASELKALREGGPWRPNAGMLARFLAYRQTGAREETFLDGILQVPPATLLRVTEGGIAARAYWSLPDAPGPPPGDAAAHAERIRALLEDSVALRMRSDVPVGSCLSGGLDSATIVSLVAAEGRRTGAAARRAFTATFPGVPGDETPWAAASAEHAAAEWHRTAPTPAGLLEDLDRLVRAQDEPFSGPSIYAEWKVMELARDHATTVLLNGQGGDEVFAGYHFFFGDLWWSLLRRGALPTLRREMKAHAAVHGPGSAKAILLPALRSRAAGPVRAIRGGPRVPWMARDLAASLAAPAPPRPPDLRASLRESRSFRMLPHLLRQTDRSSMAFSREVRLPFLDHRLVEYADALPDAEHLEGGTTKRALREAIRGLVPEPVRTRRDKLGFALPMARWMREGLADALRDAVAGRTARERGFVDPAGAGRALDAFLAGDDAQAVPVWNCFLAERWMRACVDGPGGGP